MTQPTQIPPAATPVQPAAPTPSTPTARPAATRRKALVPRGPMIVTIALLVAIAELVIFQLVSPVVGIAINMAAALVVFVAWMRRLRRRLGSARRAQAARAATAGGRTPMMSGRGGSSPGRTGVLGRLQGLLPGRRATAGGAAGMARTASGGIPAGSSRSGGLGGRLRGMLPTSLGGSRTGSPASRTVSRPSPTGGRTSTGSPGAGASAGRSGSRLNPLNWGRGRTAAGSTLGAGGRTPVGTGAAGRTSAGRTGSRLNPLNWGRRATTPRTSTGGARPSTPSRPATGSRPAAGSTPRPRTSPGGRDMSWLPRRPSRPSAPASGRRTTNQTPSSGTQVGTGLPGAAGYRRSHFEGMSLKRFIQVLPQVPAEIAATRGSIEARAAAAAEDLPIAPGIAEELYSIAAQMRRLEERAAALQGRARQHHEADATRWDAPRRGSHAVEERADNRAARRDT